jgi:hypothetical protein
MLDPVERFRHAKRVWNGLDFIRIQGTMVRLIHVVQDCLDDPEFTLDDESDRDFFWKVVEQDFKRLDRLNWKSTAQRSKKYYEFLVKLENIDRDKFFQLVTQYPSMAYNINEYQWLTIIR